ncbi:MAG TPA: hypothetical protein VG847_07240 [Chitinophagaceae bacterium]|nr:hypothetical protein [Chitinophagaceae bacterium]
MKKFLLIMPLLFLSVACKKEKAGVFVRIQNVSGSSFADIQAGNTSFGSIHSSVMSSYKLITNPVYAAGCTVVLNDSSFYIGYGVCGTPLPAPFDDGKYTFIIKKSVSLPGYYDVDLKKNSNKRIVISSIFSLTISRVK